MKRERKLTSLVTSLTSYFAISICCAVPSIYNVLSVEVSPGGKCKGMTCRRIFEDKSNINIVITNGNDEDDTKYNTN